MSSGSNVKLSPGDQKRINSGRKRKVNISNWSDKKRKMSKDSGNPYISKKKKPVPGKLPPTEGRVCSCQYNCGDINHGECLQQFQQFHKWDYNAQTTH